MFKMRNVNIKPGSDSDATDKAHEVYCIKSSDHADNTDSSMQEDEILSPSNE